MVWYYWERWNQYPTSSSSTLLTNVLQGRMGGSVKLYLWWNPLWTMKLSFIKNTIKYLLLCPFVLHNVTYFSDPNDVYFPFLLFSRIFLEVQLPYKPQCLLVCRSVFSELEILPFRKKNQMLSFIFPKRRRNFKGRSKGGFSLWHSLKWHQSYVDNWASQSVCRGRLDV